MGKGSDMQGTPPRDLRLISLIVSVYAAIFMVQYVCLCVPVSIGEMVLAQITKSGGSMEQAD